MSKGPIPAAALAQHIIVLGKTRSGKSSKMRVLVEHLLQEEKPVCIIDPKGDWWGLKSAADGKHAGYPIVIFGGKHADVPLNPKAGAAVAELIATANRPCLIDLKGWMPGERTRFYIDFVSTLFKLHQGERHLVIDEVHNFAPKGKVFSPEAGMMLHWSNTLASEGQGQGLIMLAASQRPQKVHNDLLTSCETLIACRVIHKADRDAIKDWIDGCADPAIGKKVLLELAGMNRSEAWCWSPEIEFGPERIEWPLFETYDSFKPQKANTPKLKGWAEVDLEKVKAQLATVIEEARANDPAELRKEIAALRRELTAPKNSRPGPSAEDLQAAHTRGHKAGFEAASNQFKSQVRVMRTAAHKALEEALTGESTGPISWTEPATKPRQNIPRNIPTPSPARAPQESGNGHATPLGKAERKILSVLAQFPEGCSLGKLTLLTGYRKSGGFLNSLSALRTAGYMDGANTSVMRITAEGLAQGPFPELPQGDDLLRYWLEHPSFGICERKVLAALAQNPDGLTVEEICAETDYKKSGGFLNSLSALRTAGVLVGKNTETMRVSPEIL